jgi:uncharacterized protein (DUF305 family)
VNGSSTKGRPVLAATAAHTEHVARRSEMAALSDEMHQQMQVMMAAMDAAPMNGDPDQDFLAMMIPHHQGAVDMARLVLVHGQDPLVRQLADEIIASQRAEIASMTERLKILRGQGQAELDSFPAYTGTRGR